MSHLAGADMSRGIDRHEELCALDALYNLTAQGILFCWHVIGIHAAEKHTEDRAHNAHEPNAGRDRPRRGSRNR
ncbi:hypothetical protein FOMPIDRAFT_129700 [Fomitopsis schrenkii]|uniref:Uncharacterized protein n=1 Tax=Fomitopsis schrenkii TaxID=2126942 RepID=S8E9Z6_FOMSC|nr:hypothetical protein FOMPIDRAFT_129700 [Fomitopsis schrenkii]